MKKILILLLFLISLSGYAANEITGAKEVCPGQQYTYIIKFTSASTQSNLPLTVNLKNGKFYGTNQNFNTFYLQPGMNSMSINVVWDNTGGYNYISASASLGSLHLTVGIASLKNTYASDYNNYGFKSTPTEKDGIIRIPYEQSGTLSMNVSNTYYPYCFSPDYLVKTFRWTVNGASVETTNSYSLNYSSNDLDGATINVAPVGKACGATTIGGAASYRIERYINANISSNLNSSICSNTNVNFTLSGIPKDAIITWSTGTNFTYVSGQGSNTATYNSYGNGYGSVKAIVSYRGKDTTFESPQLWIGAPLVKDDNMFDIPLQVDQSTPISVSFDGLDGTGQYKWTKVSGNFYLSGNGPTATITPWDNKFIVFRVDINNKCGTGSAMYQLKAGGLSGGLNSTLRTTSINDTDKSEIKSVRIYNLSGILVYANDEVNGIFDINSTVLTNGVYIIEKFDGKSKTSDKVMLKR